MMKIRELVAYWVLMHEHPFIVVKEESLNYMLKYEIPEWTRVSYNTCKGDCFKVYDNEKKKLKTLFRNVSKTSLTTDYGIPAIRRLSTWF